MNTRLADLDSDIDKLRRDASGRRSGGREIGERLWNVEIPFKKVSRQSLTLERAVIPAADGVA